MKKILLSKELKSFIHDSRDILNRSDFYTFIATSAEDVVKTHRAEHVDLIILQLDMDGVSAENICSFLRNDEGLRCVSILIICNNTKTDIDRIQKCKANSYLTRPILHEQLMQKISQLLAISDRQDYRVLLKIKVNGNASNVPFFCYSSNISVSGMLIETEKKLNNGVIISCSFFLPDSEQIFTEAEIMRTVRTANGLFQYGLRYLNLGPGYRAAIERFVKRRAKKT